MTEKQKEILKNIVRESFFKNASSFDHVMLDEDVIAHVIHTGTDLLASKFGINPFPGGFVKNILENKLLESYFTADDVNEKFIKFYVLLNYNTSKPIELIKE